MQKSLLLALLLYIICGSALASTDSLFMELDKTIHKRAEFEFIKNQHIDSIKNTLLVIQATNDLNKFETYRKLLEEYELYKYDSAFSYALLLNEMAYKLNNNKAIAIGRLKMGIILGAKGLFKEAIDSLELVNIRLLNKDDQTEYYKNKVKLYFDLEHYTDDPFYSPFYKNIALAYCDSVINNCSPESFQPMVYSALKKMVTGNFKQSIPIYIDILNNYETSLHQKAQYNATLGFMYKIIGDKNLSINYLTIASMADIQANIKETTALRGLAEMLFANGDVEKAYKYILIAKKDAEFYGTKHRQLEISGILPRIEGAYLNRIDIQRRQMVKSVVLVAILSFLALAFLIVALLQLAKLKKARKVIIDKNKSLRILNTNLEEANVIKEEYIGYYFNISSQYIDKIDKLKKSIERQLTTKQYQNISLSLRDIDPKKEHNKLFEDFDTIFLSIFPDYINEYNKLFKPEDIIIEKGNKLSTPQRIFALLRIGIKDNEKIAKILNFSVNTIYTYKTKAKNKALISNDEFEHKIMAIHSV